MIERPTYINEIQAALSRSRIVTLIGPRQSGKTTLARVFVSSTSVNYFDLEDPVSLSRLEEPMTALRGLTGLVVIDEIQRRLDLFPSMGTAIAQFPPDFNPVARLTNWFAMRPSH
jgi:predicted AAA+ superfamily ATPase